MVGTLPNHLCMFIPKVCLDGLVLPGGWDPKEQVVPAFDPDVKSPDSVKEAFHFGDDRVLVSIKPEYIRYFHKRKTGPSGIGSQGIYASERSFGPLTYEVVNQDYSH